MPEHRLQKTREAYRTIPKWFERALRPNYPISGIGQTVTVRKPPRFEQLRPLIMIDDPLEPTTDTPWAV